MTNPIDDLVLENSEKSLRVREGDRTSTISMKEALLRKQRAMALGDNRLAINAPIRMIEAAEQNKARGSS